MDYYTMLFLLFCFVVLSLCFYVIYWCRKDLVVRKDSEKTDVPSLRSDITNKQLQTFRSDTEVLYRPNPISKIDPPPDYIRLALSKQFIPHYIPEYLWECVDILEYTTGYYLPIFSQAYIWAVYFYVFAKTVRSQSVVDDLYSRQHKDAISYFHGRTSGIEPYIVLSNSYKRIAPILNASGIDPRTPDGRNQLWELLCQWVHFPDDCIDVGKKKFRQDCITIRYFVRKLYGVDYPVLSPQYSVNTSADPEMPTK